MQNKEITCHLIEAINRIRNTRKSLKFNFEATNDLLKAEECIYNFANKCNERLKLNN